MTRIASHIRRMSIHEFTRFGKAGLSGSADQSKPAQIEVGGLSGHPQRRRLAVFQSYEMRRTPKLRNPSTSLYKKK